MTGSLVSGNYFELLGTRAAAGRLLTPGDAERPGEAPVVVLGHRLATGLFGSPAAALGGTVDVNGSPLQVVGVAAEGFRGHDALDRVELWVPVTEVQRVWPAPFDLLAERDAVWLLLFGRLAPAASVEQVEAELGAAMAARVAEFPDLYEGRGVAFAGGVALSPGAREDLQALAWKLLGAVALVLLVVCANVANLQLARVSDRRRELGIRLALGARRGTVVRQVLGETLLLSGVGGGLGLLVAYWSGGLLRLVLSAADLGQAAEAVDLAPDGRVLAFGLAAAAITGVLAGLAPALHATAAGAETHLRDGRSSARGGRSTTREALVVGQIALSLVLLTVAALYLQSVAGLRGIDPGFDAGRVWTAGLRVEGEGSDDRVRSLVAQVLEVAEAVPDVEAAGVGDPLPLSGSRMSAVVTVAGWQPPPEQEGFGVDLRDVSPGYFETLGIELLRGRPLQAADGPAAEPVAVVNETMAQRFWPEGSAVGETFSETGGGRTYRIVGVVSDMKYLSLTEQPRLHVCRAAAQSPYPETVLHVRAAAGDPRAVGLAVRQAVAREVPRALLYGDRTLQEQLELSIGPIRIIASLTGLFGALALLLAAVGLAGTLVYYVRTHLHEIGVRVALGADRAKVAGLVVGRGLRRVLLGLALGVPAALAASQAVASELYGAAAEDPWTYGAVTLALLAVALAAALPAAVRATRAQPASILRGE